MKRKPKGGALVYQVYLDEAANRASDLFVDWWHYGKGYSWRFNCFATKREALKARKEIIRILRGS